MYVERRETEREACYGLTLLFFFFVKIADRIRELVDDYDQMLPTIVEIPSKEHPYEEDKDSMMTRVKLLTAARD
jgi:vacuolar-type H+-ATPase subunit F/Vma7